MPSFSSAHQWMEGGSNLTISDERLKELIIAVIAYGILLFVVVLLWNYCIARNEHWKIGVKTAFGAFVLLRIAKFIWMA